MECGDCTLCCKLLNIQPTNSPSGIYCEHCAPNFGCRIYAERPDDCKIFECAWKQMNNVGIGLRPDMCNVVFEKWSDFVMVGIIGGETEEVIQRQIDSFRGEGISVLMVDNKLKTRTFFLAPKHTKEFVKEQIDGRTKLY